MGYDAMVSFDVHVGDDEYETTETQARATWYGVSGIPHVILDGTGNAVGGIDNDCEANAVRYRDMISGRLAETGGLSPVHILSEMDIVGGNCTMSATYKLVEQTDLGNTRATFFLYENNVDGQWQHVTRKIYDEFVTLTDLGDEAFVETTIPVNVAWNPAELHGVVCLQNYDTKEVIQAQAIGYGFPADYSSWFSSSMASVPQGNGTAEFEGSVMNIGDATDTITLEPGTGFADWSVDFLVCGDSNPHGEPVEVVLGPGEICAFTVRVHTDDVVVERNGTFLLTSASSGRMAETVLRVFNGSYSILFVDDDRSHSDDLEIRAALDALGYLYEHWDITNDHDENSPTYTYLKDFDYVIWHHSQWPQAYCLTENDVATLMSFMDNGGSLFLTSQIFLNAPLGAPEFITDYLGIASYTLDPGYTNVSGVAADPIGDGLVLPLTYTIPTLNKGDDVEPGPTANVSLTAPEGVNCGIRNEMESGSKSFFMAFAFEAISDVDPDPNNTRVVLGRIMEWLAPMPAADVAESPLLICGSTIEKTRPNPFNPRTSIDFNLSRIGASGLVRLEIVDPAGRRIARVLEGSLQPGPHVRTWDGLTEDGKPARSGIYFAKLSTLDGVHSSKLILLR